MLERYFLIFFSVLLISCDIVAAFPKDGYFLISGGAATGYESNASFIINKPTEVYRADSNIGVDIASTDINVAVDEFIAKNRKVPITKNVSFGIVGNFGYAFTKYFRAEIEGSYFKGKIASTSSIEELFYAPNVSADINPANPSIPITPAIQKNKDSFSSFNFSANFILDVENSSNMTPFLGIGPGIIIEDFWNSNAFQFCYKIIGGIDLLLSSYLSTTLNIGYIKSTQDVEAVFSLKQDKIFTNESSGNSYKVFRNGYSMKSKLQSDQNANRFQISVGLKFIL